MPTLDELPWYVYATFSVLTLLALGFLLFFAVPSIRVGFELKRVLRALHSTAADGDIAPAFASTGRFAHVWSEFRETLHEERAINPRTGVLETLSLRATVPAATFFTEEALIDTPLRTEFFKHLPGIFTGIGIIGTFTGLLVGLRAFRVTEDPAAVRTSLENLLHGVYEAFLVSALAILLAMVVTFIEKVTLVRLYGRLQRLTEAIDERFRAGVGEEYLARLVGASEQSAAHSAQLKDALVGELKTILVEISERQIASFSASQVQLGQHISASVTGTLKEPLEKLASATESVRGDQGQAVQQLMADLLAQFSSKLEGLLGGQIAGMQQMQQQTIDALKEAVGQLKQMSATVEGAGQKASETLMEKLDETLHKLEQRQLVMTEEMRKFVQEIRTLVGESQTETHQELQKLLGQLAAQTTAAVGALSERSQSAVGAMGTQVEGLSSRVGEAIAQMTAAVAKLEAVTTDAITRMNDGATTLAIAADDFARAGQGVTGTLSQAQALTGQLAQSSQALASASSSMDTVLADYRTTRDAVAQMLTTVRAAVESAKREASLTEDVVKRLETSAAKLAAAHGEADAYLEKITDVLATAHESFAAAVNRTLETNNREFLDQLSSAVKMLRETIQELEGALGGAAPRSVTATRPR